MNREANINRVRERKNEHYDFVIIGGGASGVGCAVDASSRGFDVLLLEQSDFGKGTSSRSTKLVHGGVRYLEQGNISLVREALKERGILKENAPHLVHSQAFIVPCYSLWQKFFYGTGLKVYNLLSGKYGFGKSRILSRQKTLEELPNIKKENLSGGIIYYDGQFDDTRLLIDLVKTADENDATILNYAKVTSLSKSSAGRNDGVSFTCLETNEEFHIKAKVIINATGAFTDEIREMSDNTKKIMSLSQGIHLVFDKSFLNSNSAIMIPKTSDGRVLFSIPWNGKTLVGTTDTPIENAELEPQPIKEEIDFILETCKSYLTKSPTKDDVLSVFVGIRPLVKSGETENTASLSREHTIEIDGSGLLTLAGGKWTTYRSMAEDTIDRAIEFFDLPKQKCVTKDLKIKDARLENNAEISIENSKRTELIHKDFSYTKADVLYAIRSEMARTIEDVLARRTRVLFLDAKAAIEISRSIAELIASELGEDDFWINEQVKEFENVSKNYLLS